MLGTSGAGGSAIVVLSCAPSKKFFAISRKRSYCSRSSGSGVPKRSLWLRSTCAYVRSSAVRTTRFAWPATMVGSPACPGRGRDERAGAPARRCPSKAPRARSARVSSRRAGLVRRSAPSGTARRARSPATQPWSVGSRCACSQSRTIPASSPGGQSAPHSRHAKAQKPRLLLLRPGVAQRGQLSARLVNLRQRPLRVPPPLEEILIRSSRLAPLAEPDENARKVQACEHCVARGRVGLARA